MTNEPTIKDVVKYLINQAGWGKGLEVQQIESFESFKYGIEQIEVDIGLPVIPLKELKTTSFPLDKMAIIKNPFSFQKTMIRFGMDNKYFAFYMEES